MTDAAPAAPDSNESRPRRRWALWLTAALAVGFVLGLGLDLYRVKADLDSGVDRLDNLDLDTIRDLGLEETLASSASDLRSASTRAHSSIFMRALTPIPLLGDQIEAVQDLSAAAAAVGDEAEITGARIGEALDGAGADPEARVTLLAVVVEELDRIETFAADLDIGADGTLVGPVKDARRKLDDELADLPIRLAPIRAQIAALRDLLTGPTDYLIMVGNNAEMRAGAGMPLSIGVASIEGGDIELGDFLAATTYLFADNPTGEFNAAISPELRATYPNWLIGQDFPETAVVPNFPVTAPIYADIALDTQGWETDGALHLDAVALAELLAVVGPVEVGGVEYNSETAPQLVLNQTYKDFDGESRFGRYDAQSDLAQGLFEAITERDVDLLDIVAALQKAADGRHLMAWSRDGVLEELFGDFGADGSVTAFDTLVSVQNTSANKLDWYIEPSVDVTVEPTAGGTWLVTVATTVLHPDRERTVGYIEGPYRNGILAGGAHRTLVTVQVPPQAFNLTMPGEAVSERGFDGTSNVIGTRIIVPRDSEHVVVTQFELPEEFNFLSVVPSARVRPVPWTVNGVAYDDATRFVTSFGSFPSPSATPQILRLTGFALVVAGIVMLLVIRRRPTPTLLDPEQPDPDQPDPDHPDPDEPNAAAVASEPVEVGRRVAAEERAAKARRIDQFTVGGLILVGIVLVVASGLV